ncbi:MAG: ribonuclease III [Clostridia bacterium]|nr:ribonuclease III [Clostridia bacterium]
MEPGQMKTADLAYLGDAVIELWVRERLLQKGVCGSGRLNKAALCYVKATAQAAAVMELLPMLTEEETAIWKRGRNSHCGSVPKSANVAEYRAATGLEVLCGYLRLTGRVERIDALLAAGYRSMEEQTEF